MTQTMEAPETAPAKSAITLSNLKRALKIVEPSVPRSASLPILQSVRIEQSQAGLVIEGNNLEVAIRALIAESNGPASPTVIPAERLMGWVKLLTGEEVSISVTDRRATVKCGRSKSVLPILPASNWPATRFQPFEKYDSITLKQGALARALKIAQLATGEGTQGYTLSCILLTASKGKLRCVATDGHRMAIYTFGDSEPFKDMLLPESMTGALLPLLTDADGGVDVSNDEHYIFAAIPGDMPAFVAGKKVAMQFPHWEQLMPKDDRTMITVNARAFLEATQRAALLADAKSNAVVLTFTDCDEIVIDGADSLAGEAQEAVTCTGRVKERVRIGMNSEYLIDVLRKLEGTITLKVPSEGRSPLLLTAAPHEGETLDYIVMPMRV